VESEIPLHLHMSGLSEFQTLVMLSRRFHGRRPHPAYDQAEEVLLQQMWETACDYGRQAADNDNDQEEEQRQMRVRRKRV
jgi:hypothetical protein